VAALPAGDRPPNFSFRGAPEPEVFEAIKWAGIVYLAFLAIEALRSAAAGRHLPSDHEKLVHQFGRGLAGKDISNITHRKITGKHAGKPRCLTAEEKFNVPAVARNGECRRHPT
jgi:hypothetical protein